MTEQQTPDTEGIEDFDAFWSAQDRKGHRVRIKGEIVELPASLPLQFELEARRLQRSKRDQDVRKLVAILYGDDAMEKWAAAGMQIDELQVLLAWGAQKVAGGTASFAEVAAEVAAESDPT